MSCFFDSQCSNIAICWLCHLCQPLSPAAVHCLCKCFGMSGAFLHWMQSFLSDCTRWISYNGHLWLIEHVQFKVLQNSLPFDWTWAMHCTTASLSTWCAISSQYWWRVLSDATTYRQFSASCCNSSENGTSHYQNGHCRLELISARVRLERQPL